ncbi:MAG: acyl-ACP--UDP-N-acetylglucosamine O-acyltransferase [Gammaproteobacteria bacterium]
MSETRIHPTAIVDPRATLGPGVRIGPYSVIGPEVVLGPNVEIGNHVTLESRVVLDSSVKVGHGTVLGAAPQDLKFKDGTPSGVRVGAGTVIREHVTIHRATAAEGWTEIGRDCLIMATSHIAHDCRLADHVIVINYAGLTGHCVVGERATVGGLTGVAPFTRIGAYAYLGGCSRLTVDLPPFMLAAGMPATVRAVNVVGLRRAGVAAPARRAIQDAHTLLYRAGLTPKAALDRIRQDIVPLPQITMLVEFVETARRGICGPPRAGAALDDEDMV